MTSNGQRLTLEEFGGLLDSFGADASRWPLKKRVAAEALLAESSAARKTLAEARVFDALLDRAPAADVARFPDLAARIMSAAAQPPSASHTQVPKGDVAVAANVIPLRRRTTSASSVAVYPMRRYFGTVAVLAASLAMGVMIGVSDLAPPGFTQFANLEDNGAGIEQSISTMHSDDLSDVLDEDQQ